MGDDEEPFTRRILEHLVVEALGQAQFTGT
jgi:hypothetical protein